METGDYYELFEKRRGHDRRPHSEARKDTAAMSVAPKPISMLVGARNLAERLEKHSMPEPMSGCLLWIGAICGSRKRPVLRITTDKWKSCGWNPARIAYFLAYGAFDDAQVVCHKCDNPLCVEPRHLFLGSRLDNNRDRHRKGRTKIPGEKGEQRYNHILTKDDIPKIFELYAAGVRTVEIAERFGVARQSVANVLFKRAWRHLSESFDSPLPLASKNKKIFEADRARIVELRRCGWTYAKLAQEFAVSIGCIQRILEGVA